MAQKCVHKGCGKLFTDPDEPCTYHPGPPEFHEGQKGWKCCKARVLTFDEFLSIPPCTTGKHSIIDETQVQAAKPFAVETKTQSISVTENPSSATTTERSAIAVPRVPQATPHPPPTPAPAPAEESEDDDPTLSIASGSRCKRKGCTAEFTQNMENKSRVDGDENCVYHPGAPIFHEGSKGYTCCKRRVLEFDQFMKIEGCKRKGRHLFVGSGDKKGKGDGGGVDVEEEMLSTVRHDFYQTQTHIVASFYLKKILPTKSNITFPTPKTITLDLLTSDNKRYTTTLDLWGLIQPDGCTFKIMGTKLELTLQKGDGSGWPVLRADERGTGEIIQAGKAGRF